MIRHVVMLKFKDAFDQESRLDWLERVRAMPDQIAEIKALSAGFDIQGLDRSWDAAIVADFENIDELHIYADHPVHVPVMNISGPNSQHIVSVDFDLGVA